MPVSNAVCDLEPDDICFAQTACAKLAKLLQGTLSVGLPSLTTGFPEPRSFFEDSFRVMEAYATVLHTIGGKTTATDLVLDLRQRSGELQNEIGRLRAALLSLSDGQPGDSLRAAREATTRICDLMSECAGLLGRGLPLFSEVKALSIRLFEYVPELCRVAERLRQ
jgi:hypothetical protein